MKPNEVSQEGSTLLTEALHDTDSGPPEYISLDCVKLLAEAGTDVNSANTETSLVIATSYGLIGQSMNCVDLNISSSVRRGEEIRTMPMAPSYLIPSVTWIVAMY